MKALIVIGIVILFFVILLNIPVKVFISYGDGLMIHLKYAFFRFDIVPPKKKGKTKFKNKRKKSHKSKKKKEKTKTKTKVTYDLVMIILGNLSKAGEKISKLLSKIVLDDTSVHLVISGKDAADTAEKFGKITAGVFGLYAIFSNIFKVKKVHFRIIPDYCLGGWKFSGGTVIKLRPAILLSFAVGILSVLLKVYSDIRQYNKNLQAQTKTFKMQSSGQNQVGQI